MKCYKLFLFTLLTVFAGQSLALNTDEWVYKEITGNLKPTPGCKSKEKAAKQASTGYRFKKYTSELCNALGYGWSKGEVLDKGELVCEPCEGEYEDQSDKYRCYMKQVTIKCKQVKAGF